MRFPCQRRRQANLNEVRQRKNHRALIHSLTRCHSVACGMTPPNAIGDAMHSSRVLRCCAAFMGTKSPRSYRVL